MVYKAQSSALQRSTFMAEALLQYACVSHIMDCILKNSSPHGCSACHNSDNFQATMLLSSEITKDELNKIWNMLYLPYRF